jgi:hypothetical protein
MIISGRNFLSLIALKKRGFISGINIPHSGAMESEMNYFRRSCVRKG